MYFSQVRRVIVRDDGASTVSSGKDPLLGCRWPVSPCILIWQKAERESMLSPQSYKGSNPIHETFLSWFHPILITSVILTHWEFGLLYMNLGRHKHSVFSWIYTTKQGTNTLEGILQFWLPQFIFCS